MEKKPGRIKRQIRNTIRFQEIISILVRYGLSEWLLALRLHQRMPGIRSILHRPSKRPPADASRAELLRLAIEELGPTFIKFGQLLSNRTDILPLDITDELSKLQDSVPPIPFEEISEVISHEFGKPVLEVFKEFIEESEASASIAQVHRAKLFNGKVVAVKIQKPKIEKLINTDLEILLALAKLAEHYVLELRHLQAVAVVQEFAKQINRELDFNQERSNMVRFANVMKDNTYIHIPKVHNQLSGSKIITMEFIEGIKLTQALKSKELLDNPKRVARRGADILLEQIFIHGFFHGDPHPGNIIVLPNERLCFLDFGMMGNISKLEQRILIDIVLALVQRDTERITDGILDLTNHPQFMHRMELEADLAELVEHYLDLPLNQIDIAEVFQALIGLVTKHKMKVPVKYLVLAKALATTEGIGLQLTPSFNLISLITPLSRRLILREFKPESIRNLILNNGSEYLSLIQEFPKEIRKILRQLRIGDQEIKFRLTGLEPIQKTVDNVGNRFTYGIVLAAVMISSSLVVHAGIPPLIEGISLIGILGFGIAGIMSIGFLFSMFLRLISRK